MKPCLAPLGVLGLLLGASLVAAPGSTKPNIVVILADDLGYGDVSCYNAASKVQTPHIDRLAAQGLWFTDAHSPTAVCTPTRYALLTGRYSWRTRLGRGVLNDYGLSLIDAGRLTLPAFLAQHGYRTACVGKWHLGLKARYLKFTFPPLNITAEKLRTTMERNTYRVVGLAEVNIFEAGRHDLARPGGLPGVRLGRQGGEDEAILFDPSGKVLMGEVRPGETRFRHRETRNIEVPFPQGARLRLIMTDDLIEVYVNNYYIRAIETKTPLTGRMWTIGNQAVGALKAWNCEVKQ